MPFTRPTLTELTNRIQSDFQTRIDGCSSMLRRSVLKVMSYVYAGACHLLYGYLDYISQQLFAIQADSTYLNTIGSENDVVRLAATKASGDCATTGTNGTVIPAGTELQSEAEVIYTTDSEVTVAGGVASLDITAKEAGADGNDAASITLTFISPIAGLSSTATVTTDAITGGTDEETDDDYRERILYKRRNPPKGGCRTDFINWMKEISGVTRVWLFAPYTTDGTVAVAFTMDNEASIVPTLAQRTAAYNYLIEHTDPLTGETVGVPVTCEPGLSIITLTTQTVNFNISIYPNTSAIQAQITAELETLLYNEGGPGETIYLSQIDEAISQAAGEERHVLTSPLVDQTFANNKVPILGTINFLTL